MSAVDTAHAQLTQRAMAAVQHAHAPPMDACLEVALLLHAREQLGTSSGLNCSAGGTGEQTAAASAAEHRSLDDNMMNCVAATVSAARRAAATGWEVLLPAEWCEG